MLKNFFLKWAFLLLILAFNLIIGIKTGIGFFYFFFWLLLAIIGISFSWLIAGYFSLKLSLERQLQHKTEEGGCIEVEAKIESKGFLPIFNLLLEDIFSCVVGSEGKKWIFLEYLLSAYPLRLKYSFTCPQRGKFRVGPIAAYFFDPFCLFFLKKTFPLYAEIFVFPKTFRVKKFPLLIKGAMPWFGIQAAHTSGDEDEFYGVREYKEGDPIKRIHWLSSARKSCLVVKQFQRQSFFRATLMFNLEKDKNFGEGEDSACEYMVKIAASVAKYLLENDVALEVHAQAQEAVSILSNKGSEHLEDILKFLAVAQAESRVSLGEVFEQSLRHIADNTILIVIMLDKDWRHLAQLLPLEKRNISLVPLILVSSSFVYEFDKQEFSKDVKITLSKEFNFKPILFSRGDDLEGVFLNA
ncbi:MAG: DUF58 domain-containing protein [Candidatus Omnitrophota bacterium]